MVEHEDVVLPSDAADFVSGKHLVEAHHIGLMVDQRINPLRHEGGVLQFLHIHTHRYRAVELARIGVVHFVIILRGRGVAAASVAIEFVIGALIVLDENCIISVAILHTVNRANDHQHIVAIIAGDIFAHLTEPGFHYDLRVFDGDVLSILEEVSDYRVEGVHVIHHAHLAVDIVKRQVCVACGITCTGDIVGRERAR